MKNHRYALIAGFAAAAIVAAISFASPAKAANTIFLTDKNANISFPLSPPNRATGAPGAMDNMAIGATTPAPGSFSQIIPAGGLPTIASGACGTTTNGAVVAGSTNQSMQITIGSATTTSCTISFSKTLSPVPKSCTFSPMTAASAGSGVVASIAAPSGTGVVLSGTALTSTSWAIHCL